MSDIFAFSEAVAIGMHAMCLLAMDTDGEKPIHEIAIQFKVSEAHLAKVMQLLRKANLTTGTRGPHGGYKITRDPGEITLLEIYMAIEGQPQRSDCLFRQPVCVNGHCVLGNLMSGISNQIITYMSETSLSTLLNDANPPARLAR